jgi:hypothetical protein
MYINEYELRVQLKWVTGSVKVTDAVTVTVTDTVTLT